MSSLNTCFTWFTKAGVDLGRGCRRCPFRPQDDLQLPNITIFCPKKKRNKVETFIRKVLALLLVRADVLRTSLSCALFMDVLRNWLRFYAYQLVIRHSFVVHHLLNKILDPPLKSTAHKLNKDAIMAMR